MDQMIDLLWLVARALVVLGIIIVIHELGHFLVAKFFKIKVETFSVGFGPRLFGYKYGETDYRISLLPLGGYVKMSGENPGDTVTGDPREFMSKPKWQRFLVAGAGPAMNIILAAILVPAAFMYGVQFPAYMSDAVIGYVEPGSPADQAGIKPEDRVVAINGKERPDWNKVAAEFFLNSGKALPITLERAGTRIESTLTPIHKETRAGAGGYVGMYPPQGVVVTQVIEGGPAHKAGIMKGDEIVAVNGVDLKVQVKEFKEILQEIPAETFPIKVSRSGELKEFSVTPVMVTEGGNKPERRINVQIRGALTMMKLGFSEAVDKSIDQNIENASLIVKVLGKLFIPVSYGGLPVKNLEGPLGIIRESGNAFELGFGNVLLVMAMISLNLGLLNLLPVPILDGGVMLLIAIEGVMGRELSMRVKERIVQVSFVALLTLTAFVLYNDVVKILPSSPPPQTAPAANP